MLTAIFDIGKTNKKFFLFDDQLQEVHREYLTLPETQDEDGFPAEDLPALVQWMCETLEKACRQFPVCRLNVSTYGASLVHLDGEGKPVTPLYNYTKPFPSDLEAEWYESYGGQTAFSVQTASPPLGMLNSGLQLYWLKKRRPEAFARIRHTLHFPQYCAYLFSGQMHTEYTSLGCHTALWDFRKQDYHKWVYREGLDRLFPPIVPATDTTTVNLFGQTIQVGAGIHDSSAALLPYLKAEQGPFLLLSTGTWNIALNPFSQDELTAEELGKDCLNYLRPDGQPVKAARLFFGHEFDRQLDLLNAHFGQGGDFHQHLRFDPAQMESCRRLQEPRFHLASLQYPDGSINSAPATDLSGFAKFTEAYYRLLWELLQLQAHALRLAAGSTPLTSVLVDGGFARNDIFLHLLQALLPGARVQASEEALGSALGAAMVGTYPMGKMEH